MNSVGIRRLTPRQTEVMNLIVAGGTSKTIAKALGMSPRTVDAHVRLILFRLGARSRAHAIAIWLDR